MFVFVLDKIYPIIWNGGNSSYLSLIYMFDLLLWITIMSLMREMKGVKWLTDAAPETCRWLCELKNKACGIAHIIVGHENPDEGE